MNWLAILGPIIAVILFVALVVSATVYIRSSYIKVRLDNAESSMEEFRKDIADRDRRIADRDEKIAFLTAQNLDLTQTNKALERLKTGSDALVQLLARSESTHQELVDHHAEAMLAWEALVNAGNSERDGINALATVMTEVRDLLKKENPDA